MIEIRETIPEDADDLKTVMDHEIRFLRKVYRPTEAACADKSRIARDLTRLVAISEGKVVGTTQYYIENGVMRLLGLAVHEAYRRQGIALALVNRILEISKEKGISTTRLSTIGETGNVFIFERLGFEVVGENTDNFFVGSNGHKVTDVEMEWRLPDCRTKAGTR